MRNVATNVAKNRTQQKARHRKSMPSFELPLSGRRDLNPRPPEPHFGTALFQLGQPDRFHRENAYSRLTSLSALSDHDASKRSKNVARYSAIADELLAAVDVPTINDERKRKWAPGKPLSSSRSSSFVTRLGSREGPD